MNHLKVVNDGLRIFLFLYLLVNKPFEHALGGIIILCSSQGKEIVDKGCHLLLMGESVLKDSQRRLPGSRNCIDRLEVYTTTTLDDVVEEDLGMVLFLLELHLKPLAHTGLTIGMQIGSH